MTHNKSTQNISQKSDFNKGLATQSPLNNSSSNHKYDSSYNPNLLFGIARQDNRTEIGIQSDNLPFIGLDIWTAYEVSWLNNKGKPQLAIADFSFAVESPYLIESKSFKLYLNSFNQTKFDNNDVVETLLTKDLTKVCGEFVSCELRSLSSEETLLSKLPGICLDDLDIEVEDYHIKPTLLKTRQQNKVFETVNSNLLKSNCLVTGQPDWGTIVIRYEGLPIDHECLLKYIISFRNHNEFHEQCIERIFVDIMEYCNPDKLTVYARYVRRGGLDINPYRSNFEDEFDISRLVRQ